MFDTAIIVLLYNKEISDSTTLSSLISSGTQFSNAKLVIWNNGPNELTSCDVSFLTNLGYKVQIEETLHNESLAVIYNFFINNNQAEKYIFLDDDSTLNANYIKAACRSAASVVSMPMISSGGKVKNPVINSIVYSKGQNITANDKVITIGSGLVVGKGVVHELLRSFNSVFDERFYLYGVDTTFCHRLTLSRLVASIRIIVGFEHSLSRLETESERVTKFRQKERSYDFGMTLRYYYSFPRALYILARITLHVLKCILLSKKRVFSILFLFRAYITGKHYKAL
ncbi:hypothetical protein [Pseudoalteromonas sp. NZS11_1]|uniref:hypothetical protein n=1 Tax=Pseudoalteromonas sp. NZS11_1 TaxID=2792070 RepID=UPI0018CC8D8A|nr:hypothetical protein [Pseudoalteromonas sp. NZS11_1]MBH0044854.1 hypothetical protein [Pseudoalteromonas sp. NZS11_1]